VRPPQAGEQGTTLWKFSTKGTLISSPALGADGTLYVGSMDGKLYAFNSSAGPASASAGPFSGTWYGLYESPLFSGKVRAVLVQQGTQLLFTWFLDGAGRGEAHGTVQGNRIEASLPIKTARCQGTLSGDGRLEKGEIRAEVRIDRCMGSPVTGKLTLRHG